MFYLQREKTNFEIDSRTRQFTHVTRARRASIRVLALITTLYVLTDVGTEYGTVKRRDTHLHLKGMITIEIVPIIQYELK